MTLPQTPVAIFSQPTPEKSDRMSTLKIWAISVAITFSLIIFLALPVLIVNLAIAAGSISIIISPVIIYCVGTVSLFMFVSFGATLPLRR